MPELPDSDPPFFFRRVWAGSTEMDSVMVIDRRGDSVQINLASHEADLDPELRALGMMDLVPQGLVIYGRSVDSRYEEDRAFVESARARGQVFAECFSVACVEGEVGTHPLAAVTEISREEFEAARERGWDG